MWCTSTRGQTIFSATDKIQRKIKILDDLRNKQTNIHHQNQTKPNPTNHSCRVFGQLLLTLAYKQDTTARHLRYFHTYFFPAGFTLWSFGKNKKKQALLPLAKQMQQRNTFHLKRVVDTYFFCVYFGNCRNAELKVFSGHWEQCSIPQHQWKQGLKGGSQICPSQAASLTCKVTTEVIFSWTHPIWRAMTLCKLCQIKPCL